MVYRGPSTGSVHSPKPRIDTLMVFADWFHYSCGTCRRRRVKCDGGRPRCLTCTRRNDRCDGYDNFFDRVHRNQNDSLRQRSQAGALVKPSSEHRDASTSFPTIGIISEWISTPAGQRWSLSDYDSRIKAIAKTIPYGLPLGFESAARNLFLMVICTDDAITRAMGGCMYWLIPMLNTVSAHSPLHKAVLAASTNLAVLWSASRCWSSLPHKYYVEAVKSLREAVADEQRSRDDDVLMAALVLDFCDGVNAHFRNQQEAHLRSHQVGAVALARHRSSANFKNETSRAMLITIQTAVVDRAFQGECHLSDQCRPLFEDPLMPDNLLTRLDKLSIHLTNLLARTRTPELCEAENLQLCLEFLELDAQFDEWQTSASDEQMPRFLKGEQIPKSIRQAGVYQDTCGVYHDAETANAWNGWRSRRIVLLLTLRKLISYTYPSDCLEDISMQNEALIQSLTDGICESVPFFLGDYSETAKPFLTTEITFPIVVEGDMSFPQLPVDHARLVAGAGGLMMMDSLSMLCELTRASPGRDTLKLRDGQREWIVHHIKRLQ